MDLQRPDSSFIVLMLPADMRTLSVSIGIGAAHSGAPVAFTWVVTRQSARVGRVTRPETHQGYNRKIPNASRQATAEVHIINHSTLIQPTVRASSRTTPLTMQKSLTQAREEPEQFYAAQLITSAAPSSFCSHRCACLHRRTTHHQFEIRIDSTCKLVCNVLLEQ